ncbi:hypothetical protein [Salaquimonas pukyongi]|uniref:hypothetical protein n=1 Tax=Salaquimonas pukyongi TaxID=2712698 RepID=UPI0012EB0AEF|nr:hypothetical protein [Salaquimonas pukyongi]
MISWKQFEWMDFSCLARRIPQQDVYPSCEDFDEASAKKTPQVIQYHVEYPFVLQSPEPGSRALGLRCKTLTVPALLRFLRLAEDPVTGVQTIPSNQDTL